MSILYISPTGAGRKDGSSIENAGTLGSLNQFISAAGPGGEVLMLADQGAYQRNTQISITCGGTDGAPVTIRGIDSGGHPMDAEIRGARAENWTPGQSTGSELFRLLSGANNLVFEDMDIRNVGNGAFRIGADIQNLTIRDVDATNVTRFVENYVSGTAATASVDGLNVQNVNVAGYSSNAIRLQYDSHNVTIQNVTGDSQCQNGGLYVSGIMLAGTVHDVLISQTEMHNSFGRGGSSEYWNGDGFTTERGTYNIRFEDTVASGNTDAGYDLKSENTVLVRALAEGNNQNYRLWTDSITMTDSTSRDPMHYGGNSPVAHVWFSATAVVTLERFDFSDSATPEVLFNLGQSGATLRLIDTDVPPDYEDLIKVYQNSQIIYLHTPSAISVSGGTVAENSAGGTLVGTLSVADVDAGDSHSFAFAAGSHPLFEIVGNQILVRAGAVLDYEASHAHNVSITATDSAGLQVTRDFTVTLTDVADTATSGADILVGTGGKLAGGLGNDTYIVTHITDVPVELSGQGNDTVKTSLASYTLGANLENLVYTGHGNFNGTGNSASNQITGGDGADTLRGGNGNDVINGGGGNDVIYGDANRDQIHGGAGNDIIRAGTFDDKAWGDDGNDQLFGDDGNDTLYGGTGNDILTGGRSCDTLVGGDGADTYQFGHGDGVDRIDNRSGDSAADKVQFAAGVFVDEIWLSQQGDDLVASLLGSPDQIIFDSWFSGGQVDRMELADGTHLDAADVVDLLSAMSAVGAPPMSLDALTPVQHDAVMAAMATAWTPDL